MTFMVSFENEIDITMFSSICESIQYSLHLVQSDNPYVLQDYSNIIFRRLIYNQVAHFTNSRRVIGS